MSKKYVIEIKPEYEDTTKGIIVLGARDSNLYVDALDIENLEELNSDYINEHYGSLQDTAYKKGLHDGESKCGYCIEYQRGLNDAWEAARKISLMPPDEIEKVFPGAAKYNRYNLGYSGVEAIERLKAYEEQKADDEIKVGDEVVWTEDEDVVIVVTRVHTVNNIEWCDGVCRNGKVYQILTEHARKTGRRFDIDKILGEMKE